MSLAWAVNLKLQADETQFLAAHHRPQDKSSPPFPIFFSAGRAAYSRNHMRATTLIHLFDTLQRLGLSAEIPFAQPSC